MGRSTNKKYTLFISRDGGRTYQADQKSDDISIFDKRMDELDKKRIPWCVKDKEGVYQFGYRISLVHKIRLRSVFSSNGHLFFGRKSK